MTKPYSRLDIVSNGLVSVRVILIFLVMVTLGTVGLTIYTEVATQRSTAASAIKAIVEKGETSLAAFFRPVAVNLELLKRWGQRGILDAGNSEAMNAKLIPMLEAVPQIYSIKIATESKLEYMVMRDDNGWRSHIVSGSGEKNSVGLWQLLSPEGRILSTWEDEKPLIPAKKAWYQGAVAAKESLPYWTAPHALYPEGNIGMTTATRWDQDGVTYVAAVSITMDDVRAHFSQKKISDSFRSFLYSDERVVIDFQCDDEAYSATPKTANDLFRTDGSDDPLILQAVEVWQATADQEEPFTFSYGNVVWWGYLLGLQEARRETAIGIVVPEKDLLAQRTGGRYFFVPITLGILWLGFFWYIKRYLRGDGKTVESDILLSGPEDFLLKAIQQRESERLEFKTTLRWNIRTNKPGKEIELAVLKTIAGFLNTDGGALVVGVDDEGTVTGLENDGFPNDDRFLLHFTNMFNQHIGAEFFEYIKFGIRAVGAQKIFVVSCREAPKPVFVKDRNNDKFYIRSGPSSRQLTTSQVLEYLKDKGKGLV